MKPHRTLLPSTGFTPAQLQRLEEENRSLKGTVSLLTHCREITSLLELGPVAHTALTTLVSYARAVSGFMVSQEDVDSPIRILTTHGMGKREAKGITDRIHPISNLNPEHLSFIRRVEDIRGPMVVISFASENAPPTSAVLTFAPREKRTLVELEPLRLIANHTTLALDNAFRYERARDLSFLDDLTGLYNVRYLDIFLEKELTRAKRQGYPISFLFMDLDYFKRVNDTYGHLVGSRLLVLVANELKKLVRDGDVVVRYGGDEYVMVLINTGAKGAAQVAERIRRKIQTASFDQALELPSSNYKLKISASIGVAVFPQHAADRASVLKLADDAMYAAKKHRNAVHMSQNESSSSPGKK